MIHKACVGQHTTRQQTRVGIHLAHHPRLLFLLPVLHFCPDRELCANFIRSNSSLFTVSCQDRYTQKRYAITSRLESRVGRLVIVFETHILLPNNDVVQPLVRQHNTTNRSDQTRFQSPRKHGRGKQHHQRWQNLPQPVRPARESIFVVDIHTVSPTKKAVEQSFNTHSKSRNIQ